MIFRHSSKSPLFATLPTLGVCVPPVFSISLLSPHVLHAVSLSDELTRKTLDKLHEFCRKVEELHLLGVWDLKPLINGQELMQILGIPPGPRIRNYLERYPPDRRRLQIFSHFAGQGNRVAAHPSYGHTRRVCNIPEAALARCLQPGKGNGAWTLMQNRLLTCAWML